MGHTDRRETETNRKPERPKEREKVGKTDEGKETERQGHTDRRLTETNRKTDRQKERTTYI